MSASVGETSPERPADLAARFDLLEAQEAIRRLIHEYAHGFDERDPDRFAAVWTEDAVWSAGPGHEASGLSAIREAVQAMWDSLGPSHHWSCNTVIDVDGAEAVAATDVHAVAQGADGTWAQTAATYRDRFERVGGTWLLAHRSTEIHRAFALGEPLG